MKVSIVTPSYNQGHFIQDTIESVLGQKNMILDYHIIDGGSTDNTISIIEQYNKNISSWLSQKDNGQSHAINKGLRMCSGEVINWINSDDILAKDALFHIAKGFENKATNVFIGKSIIFSDKGAERLSKGTDIYPSLAKTLGRARIDQPEHWWRKSIIDKIGPLNENLHYTMDRDWWVKYLLRFGSKGVVKKDIVLTKFRLHNESKTVSQSEAFNSERNAYYHSLAQFYQLSDRATQLESFTGASTIAMTNLPEKIDLDLLNDSFDHFLAMLCEEAYVSGRHKLTRRIANSLIDSSLNDNDKELIDRIKFKANFPSIFVKGLKWVSGK